MKTLYLECFSGISGDMTVGALLDLGADEALLRKTLASLPIQGFEVKISRVKKSGLDACDFDVILDSEHENHDHDMAYLYGASQGHRHNYGDEYHSHDNEHNHDGHEHSHNSCGHSSDGHEHSHNCEPGHEDTELCHGHIHEHASERSHSVHTHDHGDHSHHTHEHRGLADIMHILDHGQLTDRAAAIAKRIFTILGEAEAKAHGTTLEKVHFHEVGAVDSIVDIVSAAVCLDSLDVQEVIVPMLYEGCGTVRCQHGVLPVPVPAVSNIAAAQHLKLHITGLPGEFVTPTGAAIAAAVRTSDTLPEEFTIERIGLGAGKRSYEGASGLLRAMLISKS